MAQPEPDCLAPEGPSVRSVHSVRPDGLGRFLDGLPAAQAGFLRDGGFTAKAGQVVLLPGGNGVAACVLGLGEDRSPWPHGSLPYGLPEGSGWRLEPGDFDMDGAVLGFCLGAYRFRALRGAGRGPARLAGAEARGQALLLARAIGLARTLINMPANLLGPAELAEAARDLARRCGAVVGLIEGEELRREYPTVAAVGAGADRPPVVARFAWHGSRAPADAPLISLVGKGVCFDSGGYDLKPAAGMLRMKKDMGGAALILGLAQAVMEADLPVRLEVRVGCAENMVSGRAMRPLDVLTTRRGLTVEVGNTDAEGRLVLCDLLAEASDRAPDLLIDAATLTGAARVALGPDLPALFCDDDELAYRVQNAGALAHDPVWRLPLWDGYDPWLASKVADLNNVSAKPMAGAVVAALFLRRFLAPGTRWVHLDTYAWNDADRSGRPEGGEAPGLRALFNTISAFR